MKKNILLITLVGLALCSCDLDKSYLNGPSAGTFPASESEVQAGLFAAYKNLGNLDVSSTPWIGVRDNAADIGTARLNNANFQYQQQGMVQIDNALVKKVYNWIFKTVGRVHLVTDSIDDLRDELGEETYRSYLAELYCIRAYLYDIGCQCYGDFPYIDHSLGLDETYTRTPKEEVIETVLETLDDDLLDCLPLRWNRSSYGNVRIGRVAAYTLKARICLNWGYYEDAAYYADKAISLSAEGGYELTNYDTSYCGGSHEDGEPSATNIFGFEGYESSNEILWCMEYNSSISGNTHNACYYTSTRVAGGCSYFSPQQSFLDAFQCTDGKSILESDLYNWEKPWENRDPRLDLFCVRPGSRMYNIEFETNPSITSVMNYNTGLSVTNSEATGTKSEYGANGKKGPCGYLWRKYVDLQELVNNNYSFSTSSVGTLSYPLMRLSEAYLIRAEAYIELNTNLATAKSDIEAIRAKAGMPALTSSTQQYLS